MRTVPKKVTVPTRVQNKQDVPGTFDAVAAAYDLQTRLNPGYHANLRRAAGALLARVRAVGSTTPRLLDVGCGTGASTRALALALWDADLPTDVLGIDGSVGMLRVAKAKNWPPGVRFEQALAEQVPALLAPDDPEGSVVDGAVVDGVLASYLVRNVEDPDAVLRSLVDLVPRDGVVAVHDYSVRGNPLATAVWTLICWGVVIPLGWATARHTALYRYLWRSVLTFDSLPQLIERMERAGLVDVEVVPATGWQRGILHTVLGRRP